MTNRKILALKRENYEDLDRLLVVHGYFVPSIPRIAALHVALAMGMTPYEHKRCRVHGHGEKGFFPSKRSNSMAKNNVSMSLQEWSRVAQGVSDEIGAVSLGLENGIAFTVQCMQSTSHMNCDQPATAQLHVLDDPAGLRTENYSLAEIARNAVIEMDRAGHCVHALVDYGFAGGYCNDGSIYGAFPLIPMPFHMWLDFVDWGTLGAEQQHRIRRLCWGSYFGPRMAENLGPTFIEEYLSRKYDYDGSAPQTAELLPGGGMYVTLTTRPQDILECENIPDVYEMPIIRNAAWLRQRLRRLNMI